MTCNLTRTYLNSVVLKNSKGDPMIRLLFLAIFSTHLSQMAFAVEKKETPKLKTSTEIIESSSPDDWRPLKPESTLYMTLSTGRVIIELAPQFAPNHVANIKTLSQEKYWDGLVILRAQENYVVQWGDPTEKPEDAKKLVKAKEKLDAEFDSPWDKKKPFVKLKDGDIYAPEVGFVDGFHAARDLKNKRGWLLHCYSYVGAGRDDDKNGGSGKELYVVIGHAPRLLDRNVTLVGRVIEGMELLTVLPRGKAKMGFYEKPEMHVPIKSIRMGNEIPESERADLEIMKTDTKTFQDIIQARRHRPESWFAYRPEKVEICNVPIPVRPRVKK